jgi:hypothetical protein
MKNTELKSKLLKEITKSEDYQILEEVYKLLKLGNDDFKTFNLSQEQKEDISFSQKQIKDGDFLTEEATNNDIEKWLEK